MPTKVEVGQIWALPTIRYVITKVGDYHGSPHAWAKLILGDGSLDEEMAFGPLTEDGFPDKWGDWNLEYPAPKTSPTLAVQIVGDEHSRELAFFRASTHPENCEKCGAPKPCAYH